MKITVAGMGCGGAGLFTEDFKEAVKRADLAVTSVKDMRLISDLNPKAEYMSVTDITEYMREHGEEDVNLCVCASGDTGFYSIGRTLINNRPSGVEIRLLPGISSLSYFCAGIGRSYERMKQVSFHGRERSIVPYVCYNEEVFALTGGKLKAQDLARQLAEAGFGSDITMYVGENLSMEGERIVRGDPRKLASVEFSDMAVVVIHNPNYINRHRTLRDGDFVRDKAPMTKETIRALAVSELEVEPEDTVWDVGAGTGSVSCALAFKACESTVYAVERKERAAELIKENSVKTGARNVSVISGRAPEILVQLPAPDKVFVGGSGGSFSDILKIALEKNPEAVICATAVTIESLGAITEAFKDMAMDFTAKCVNASVSERLGSYNLMRSENPVYILKGKIPSNE